MRATVMHKAHDVRVENVPDAVIQNATDATWPRRIRRTSLPTSSTTPMASWHICCPFTFGPPLYGQRSLPQMQARVIRMTVTEFVRRLP